MSEIIREDGVAAADPTDTIAEAPQSEREVVFEEALEAILFAAGHPISYATLARVFEMTPSKVKEKVAKYSTLYNNSEIPRGVILLTYADSCQLCTKKYYLTEIRDALGIRKSGTLSSSSLEALAIVAYNQPVTRVFVDTLRRVDSSYAMNNLIDRGLIESKGRLDAPGRPMLYGTTTDFLRAFGLTSIDALPQTADEIKAMFARMDMGEINIEETEQIAISDEDLTVTDSEEKNPIGGESVSETSDEVYENERSAEDDIIVDDM